MKSIVHISTSHFPNDNRIYYKEIEGAKKAGYDVYFMVAHGRNEENLANKTYQLKRSTNKIKRYILNQFVAVYRLVKLRPTVVQFHDPELLPSGILLHYLLKKTCLIYDVHEDNFTGLIERGNPRKNRMVKLVLASLVRRAELFASRRLPLIIAEKYYKRYFPNSTEVLNYPIVDKVYENPVAGKTEFLELIYTGNVSIERGLNIYSELVRLNSNVRVHLVGRISSELSKDLHQNLGSEAHRLIIPYTDEFVDPTLLQEYYHQYYWTAGLAIFPKSPHYFEKELTKLFEYMMNSIPVVCSNFPTWENIVIKHQAGVSVDPEDFDNISGVINRLGANDELVNEYGANGSEAVQDYYNWYGQEENLVKLYNKVIQH